VKTSILGNEIMKTALKWRSYISFIAVGIIIPLVEIALKLEGGAMGRSVTRGLSQDFFFVGNILNGYFVTQFIMNSLWIHIPFLVVLGAGDQLAGEATGGTFRLLLTRPASRTSILFAKYLTTLLYAAALVVFLAVLSLGLGVLLFGTGDLLVPGRTIVIHPENEAPGRLLLAFALAIWGMWTVASLAFLFSSLVENAIGPLVGSMAVIIIFYIVSNIPVELFESVKPYLFTTYLDVWSKVLEEPVPWSSVLRSAGVLGAFSIGFYAVTWYIFVRKDVLS
jgi:ABC-2 type transport system permease protein